MQASGLSHKSGDCLLLQLTLVCPDWYSFLIQIEVFCKRELSWVGGVVERL